MNKYQEKLKSLGFSLKRGTTKRWAVINENTGKVGGYQTEHWDDHLDASVVPEPAHGIGNPQEGK